MPLSVIKGSKKLAEVRLAKAEEKYKAHCEGCEKCQQARNNPLHMCHDGSRLHDTLVEARAWHREIMVAVNANCLRLLSKAKANVEENGEYIR